MADSAIGDGELRLERWIDKYAGAAFVHLLSLFYGSHGQAPAARPEAIRRILLIKLHGLGNIVLLFPALRAIRERFPRAEIDFLTFQGNAAILEHEGSVTNRHYLPRKGARSVVAAALRLIPKLRSRRYDLVVDFEQFAYFSVLIAALTGAPRRVGFQNPAHCRELLYTTRVSYMDTAHMARIFLRLAAAVGAEAASLSDRRIAIGPSQRERAAAFEARARIRPDATLVIMHPGSSDNLVIRRWPGACFAALADRLVEKLGCAIVWSGSRAESPLIERIRGLMARPSASAAGILDIREMAALCERAEIVVSNDTSLVHIASAMGTPVVGLYGPNTPFLYGPLGTDDLVFYREIVCSPCLVNINAKMSRCAQPRCMESITVDEVFGAMARTYFTPAGTIKERFRKDRDRAAPLEAVAAAGHGLPT